MRPQIFKILFAISVLLNIFLFGGAVAGALLLHKRLPMIAAGAFRVAGAELPDDERHAFRTALRDTRRQSQPILEAGRQARRDAAAALVQPQLDQAAVLAALGRARAADFAMRSRLEERAIAFAATLPAADRQRLAEGLLRRPGRAGRRIAATSDGSNVGVR